MQLHPFSKTAYNLFIYLFLNGKQWSILLWPLACKCLQVERGRVEDQWLWSSWDLVQGHFGSVNACHNICYNIIHWLSSTADHLPDKPGCVTVCCLPPSFLSSLIILSPSLSCRVPPAVCPCLVLTNRSVWIGSDCAGNTSIMPFLLYHRSTARRTWKPVLGCIYFRA